MKPDVNQSLNSKSKKRMNERIQCQSEQMTKENTFQNTDRVLSNYSFPFPSYKKSSYSVSNIAKADTPIPLVTKCTLFKTFLFQIQHHSQIKQEKHQN